MIPPAKVRKCSKEVCEKDATQCKLVEDHTGEKFVQKTPLLYCFEHAVADNRPGVIEPLATVYFESKADQV